MFNFLKIFLLGFFYLTSSVHLSYSAQEITGEFGVKTSLRICADPNNLPYSSQDNEGYENKIVNLFIYPILEVDDIESKNFTKKKLQIFLQKNLGISR